MKNTSEYQPIDFKEMAAVEKIKSKSKTDNIVRIILLMSASAALICLLVVIIGSLFDKNIDGLVEKAMIIISPVTSAGFAYFAGKNGDKE